MELEIEKTASSGISARVCRLCLSSRGEILPIFESGSRSDSDSPPLASIIKACVSVEITEDDRLPSCVCRKCHNNVNNWHTFKKVCADSQAKLQDWLKNDCGDFEKVAKIKTEPFLEENNDNEDITIDGRYELNRFRNGTEKILSEGPPILASLGLAPRSDKDIAESEEEEEEEEDDAGLALMTSTPGENSMSSNHSSGLHVSQLGSKHCLVCGRAYRYSHNARRHELSAHNYDRYTNKRKGVAPKLRPNPFNPKARMLSNPINPQSSLFSKISSKLAAASRNADSDSYPLRIKALSDLQIKVKTPEILKTLLSAQPDTVVSEPEIMQSGSESPETLVSEPEISSYQVETIITEPDSIDHMISHSDEEGSREDDENSQNRHSEMIDMESYNEIEIAREEVDIDDDIGMDQNGDAVENDEDDDKSPDMNETSQDYRDDDDCQNEIEADEPAIQEEVKHSKLMQSQEESNEEGDFPNGSDEDDEDDLPLVPIAPIVEINEEPHVDSFTAEINDESKTNDEEEQYLKVKEDPTSKSCVTKAQKEFILKYRDIIEQINTKECHCCQRSYPRRKAVIQHLQKNGLKIPKHTCYNCVITFSHIGALLSHMRANVCTDLWRIIYREGGITDDLLLKNEEGPSVVTEVNKGQYKDLLNARSYACRLCPAKFQLKLFVMKHVIDTHENGLSKIPLLCQHCGCRFKENRLWKKHMRNGECTVNIACDLCSERFLNMLDFNEHAMTVHIGNFVDQGNENSSKSVDGRPTDCTICDKNMSSYHNLVKHLRNVHNEDKPHMCRHCDLKFEAVADLNHHIYLEHNEHPPAVQDDADLVKQETEEYNNYTCADCKIEFESVETLTDHQIEEHGQEAHPCDQCDKKFLRASELTEHKNNHLKVKFFTCTICSNSYSSLQGLNDHMATDHSERANRTPDGQFYCEICVRSFKSRQAYSNHMRIHAKVPTHNRRAGDVRSPSSHRIIKPNPVYRDSAYMPYQKQMASLLNAPYSCDICGKGFIHKKNIWKHKKVLHPEVVSQMKSPDRYISINYPRPEPATEEDEDYPREDGGAGLSIPQFDSFTSAAFEAYEEGPAVEMPCFKCDLCGKKFSAKTSVWKHKRIKHGIVAQPKDESGESGNRTSCTICKINFSDKKSYYRHRKNVHKVSAQMCKICGKHLNSALELYEHLKAAHARELLGYNATQAQAQSGEADEREEPEDGDGEDDDGPPPHPDAYQARYPCDACGKTFLGLLALQNHRCGRASELDETFDCEICHKSYTSISALKSHRGWHLRSPDGKAAANNSGLWMPHNKVTAKVSKHEVPDAVAVARRRPPPPALPAPPAALAYAPHLKRRLPPEVEVTVVNPEKRARDDYGGVLAALGVGVPVAPRASGSGEDRYCALCDKAFTKRAAYQRHVEEVHRPNSVFCPVCDKSFTRKSTLLVHMRKHYDAGGAFDEADSEAGGGDVEAPLACEECGAPCRSLDALRRHAALHHEGLVPGAAPDDEDDADEDEEPGGSRLLPPPGPGEFTCGQCGDGVASPRDLIVHRQMHNSPSKFHCNICRVYFARAVDLSAHTRARHSDNDKVFFPCAMCDRFYMNKKSLQRHIENAH